MSKCKISYGIGLCRFNKDKNYRSEILMVKKRYTYHFFNFVFGYYKKYNNKQLQYLFNNMTFGEKIDILSMNFSNMWYRLWLCDPEKNYDISSLYSKTSDIQFQKNMKCFLKKKLKFDNIFLRDGGNRLRNLINNSSDAVTPWEVPKGGLNNNETEFECAKREFEEETGITASEYTILWNDIKVVTSHKDDDIIYKSIYYIAYLNKDSLWEPKIRFDIKSQLTEIEQVRWVSLDDINFLNMNEANKKRILNVYKKIIYKFKRNVKSYYYTV